MTGTNPDDEQSVFVGDYVVTELSDGGQFTGEVTDIEDGVATIHDYWCVKPELVRYGKFYRKLAISIEYATRWLHNGHDQR